MPLPERVIEPVNVSRGTLEYQVPDELEGVTNGSLSNIIRQLSSLSRHAEEIFGNLFGVAESIAARSSNLQAKIDRLSIRVTQLDSTVEEVSLQDIHLHKPFRSLQAFDQQVVARDTMPKAMLEVYLACDKPPPLDKLNPYRDDGKDGLKFYTDPNYFFELWKQEMLKDTEKVKHDKGKKQPGKTGMGSTNSKVDNGLRPNKKRLRQPHNTAERQRQKAIGRGEFIMAMGNNHDTSFEQHQLNENLTDNVYNPNVSNYSNNQNQMVRPNSIDVNRSYEQHQQLLRQQVEQQRQMQNQNYGNGHVPNAYYHQNNEPIYTPRVLMNNNDHDVPPSQRYNTQNSNGQAYQHQVSSDQPFDFSTLQNQLDIMGYQREESPSNIGVGTPTRAAGQRRPSHPPPAPPPGSSNPGTPTRAMSVQRDNLPPPPPPPSCDNQNGFAGLGFLQQLQQHQQQHMQPHEYHQSDPDLPPPPPVPESTSSLGVKLPMEHLPPSPPPPPPIEQHISGPPAPPPPPPPPPINFNFVNGNITNGDHRPKTGSPQKPALSSPSQSILSPVTLKKSAGGPSQAFKQDNVRTDLLKAIRDGIALKKVEEREKAKIEKESSGNGQTDVASILARRVALEMSDSEAGGNSDSEYDSDEWDESNA